MSSEGTPGGERESEGAGPSRRAPQSRTGRSRVAIVSEHVAFVELFGAMLDASPDLAFAGSAPDIRDGTQLVRRTRPEITLLDDDFAADDGFGTIRAMRDANPSSHLLLLTGSTLKLDDLTGALEAGADGFVRKRDSVHGVLRAIRAARDGEIVIELAMFTAIVDRARRSSPDPAADDPPLTPREIEVLELMGRGLDPQAIAEQLGIRLSTCRGYEKSIMAKLDVHSQLEAVVTATERGILRRDRA